MRAPYFVFLSFFLLFFSKESLAISSEKDSLVFDAMVDVYYSYNFQKPFDYVNPYSTHASIGQQLRLNHALVGMGYRSDKLWADVKLQAGDYVSANYASIPDLLKNIYQASLGCTLYKNWQLEAGIMPSYIGFETGISLENPTYTRCIMSDGSPFYEMAVKLKGSYKDKVEYSFVLLNGWQQIVDINHDPSLGIQFAYKLRKDLKINYAVYAGNEAPEGLRSQRRLFQNFYIDFNPEDSKFRGAFLFDFGMQESSNQKDIDKWFGAAVIGRVRLGSSVTLTGRAEVYSDHQQVIYQTPLNQSFEVKALSLTLGKAVTSKILARLEGRYMTGSRQVFFKGEQLGFNSSHITASLAFRL